MQPFPFPSPRSSIPAKVLLEIDVEEENVLLQRFLSFCDFPTLELVLFATALLSFFGMIVLRFLNPSQKGPAFWAGACLCISLAVPIRPFLRFLGPFVFFASMAFPLSLFLGLEGILRFRGVRGENVRKRILPLFFLLFAATSYAAGNHAGLRSLLNDGFMVIMLFLSAFFMVKGTRGLEHVVHGISATGCLLLGTALAYRWSLAFSGIVGEQIHASSRLVYFAAILWILTTWSFGASMAVMLRTRQYILRMADYDSLTNLPNRRNLERKLDKLFSRKNGAKRPFAIVLIDLNGLKQLNDTYGHALGDRALILTAEALAQTMGPEQMASRFGGDEFVLLDRGAADRKSVEDFKEKVRRGVEREYSLDDGRKLRLRISIGSALFPEDGTKAGDLFHRADTRMYREKQTRHALSEVVCPEGYPDSGIIQKHEDERPA